jgi:transposase-like protein
MSKSNRNQPIRCDSSEGTFSMMEFNQEFPDDAACLEWLKNRLYPDGIFCPKCGRVTKHHRDSKRPSYACQDCGRHEHPMKGTIFEDSATSLKLWFHAIFLMASTRCGISAKQIEREIGVTYKTAWRMFNRIRSLLDESDGPKFRGQVEADESFYGGKESNKHKNKRVSNYRMKKTTVAGIVERGGRVSATVVDIPWKSRLLSPIRTRVLPRTMIFTDEANHFRDLTFMGYNHRRVNHSQGVYVDGDVHTNTLEGFWSLTKNGIRGVYHNVSAKYLQMYLNEYAFRYNRRKSLGRRNMFDAFVGQIEKRAS